MILEEGDSPSSSCRDTVTYGVYSPDDLVYGSPSLVVNVVSVTVITIAPVGRGRRGSAGGWREMRVEEGKMLRIQYSTVQYSTVQWGKQGNNFRSDLSKEMECK
jgi:hypothetical protein